MKLSTFPPKPRYLTILTTYYKNKNILNCLITKCAKKKKRNVYEVLYLLFTYLEKRKY